MKSSPDLKLEITKLPKNSKGRRSYPKKLKTEIMEYATTNNLSKEQLSDDLGISIQTLIPWFKKLAPSPQGSFKSIKIEDVEEREVRVAPKKKSPGFPEGFLLLGDVKSITEFIRGINAPVT